MVIGRWGSEIKMAVGDILWWVIDVKNTEADQHDEATLLYGNLQIK